MTELQALEEAERAAITWRLLKEELDKASQVLADKLAQLQAVRVLERAKGVSA